MLSTLRMWAIGLPYPLYQTQRIKVGVDRFLTDACCQILERGHIPITDLTDRRPFTVVIVQCRHDFDPAASLLRARDDHVWN